MPKTEQQKNKNPHFHQKSLSFNEWLYLIHHLHHFRSGKGRVIHEIHHCPLFSKKNKKGKRFNIKHLLKGDKLYHILGEDFSGIVFDHDNNSYKITPQKIKGINYPLIKLNKKTRISYE